MNKNSRAKKYLIITLLMIGVFFMVGFKCNDNLNGKCEENKCKIEDREEKSDKETLEEKDELEKEEKDETTESDAEIKNKPGAVGKIEEIRKDGGNILIRVKGDRHPGYMFDEIVAVINENTEIKDKCGNEIRGEDLKEGMLVVVEVGDAVTSSLPPQGVAKYIKVQDCSKGDVQGKVKKIQKDKKDNTLRLKVKGEKNENFIFNEAIVIVNEKTEIYDSCGHKVPMNSIKKGSNIQVVFTGPVTKSIPPQGIAKIILIQ